MTFSFGLCGPRIGHGSVSSNMVLILVVIVIYVLCASDILNHSRLPGQPHGKQESRGEALG